MKKYNLAVFIGRFQPFHNGHLAVVKEALKKSKHILFLVGSANSAINIKNPFDFEQRKEFIKLSCNSLGFTYKDYTICPLNDSLYSNSVWKSSVEALVRDTVEENRLDYKKTCIVGFDKDDSSWYIKAFPQWDVEYSHPYYENGTLVNATDIREIFFTNSSLEYTKLQKVIYNLPVPSEVSKILFKIITDENSNYLNLLSEYDFIKKYKKQFEGYKYPPVFQTCDAAVFSGNHILLVRRRAAPGKGLWALPGGFLNINERIKTGIIRELKEETGLALAESQIKLTERFDHPDRSLRARIITDVGLIVLDNNGSLPKVKGSDDADMASWVSVPSILSNRNILFEDHYDIILKMSSYI